MTMNPFEQSTQQLLRFLTSHAEWEVIDYIRQEMQHDAPDSVPTADELLTFFRSPDAPTELDKQDTRHLSKSEFETVPSGSDCVRRPVEDAALRNLQLESLRKAIAELDVQGQNLLSLRYSGELTLEEIGQIYGISRMAVSKRLKKLHKKLGSSVL